VTELQWLPELPSRAEWRHLYHRFAPFQLATGDHTLAFRGTGPLTPSPAWRRAVSSWAALRSSELRAGRSGAAHGRAMAYRRANPNRAGHCDILEVTEYGTAYAGSARCDGGDGEPGRYAWLSDPLWEELSPWLDLWRAFEDTAGLYFFGRGDRTLRSDDVARLTDWARRATAHLRSDTAIIVQR
jgi:hypothetical protein